MTAHRPVEWNCGRERKWSLATMNINMIAGKTTILEDVTRQPVKTKKTEKTYVHSLVYFRAYIFGTML